MAAQCLFSLEQFEDCISLLDPLLVTDDDANISECISLAQIFFDSDNKSRANNVNTGIIYHRPHYNAILLTCLLTIVASIYCVAGRCYDTLDNRSKALKALTTAIKIDAACIEAVEYISVNGMVSKKDRVKL